MATTLGYSEAADLLNETLEEEKEANKKLTKIAENNIDYEASTEKGQYRLRLLLDLMRP